jgi:ribulose-phosphate 3-epimerase
MIDEPSRYVDRFIAASPQTITFHIEAPESDEQKDGTIAAIQAAGIGAGLAVSPRTPVQALAGRAGILDVIMIMTVEPGWGGQGFMPELAPKIAEARVLLATAGRGGLVHVDGGISHKTAEVVGRYGIDVCVVGSALFQRGRDASEEVELVRQGVRRGHQVYFAEAANSGAAARAANAGAVPYVANAAAASAAAASADAHAAAAAALGASNGGTALGSTSATNGSTGVPDAAPAPTAHPPAPGVGGRPAMGER